MQPTTEEIKLTIILGTLLVLFFAFTIVFLITIFKKKNELYQKEKEIMQSSFQQEILKTKLETQEETLSALGKELHDNIGQLLNSTKLLIGVSQRKLTEIPDTLTIAEETLGTAINELRSLSKALNKEWLQQFNFIENLETEIRRINASDSLQIHFTNTGNLPLKNDEQIILFRIVQEAMQNAIKHAHANNILITIVQNEKLIVTITDDGTGISNIVTSASGVGLLNMQHRTQLLGGSIEWKSSPKGTAVIINLPFKTTEE